MYVSSATKLFSDDDLLRLLETSRTHNKRVGVTGILLYRGGNFIQALEGPDDAVEATYQRIRRDPRHYGVYVLVDEPLDQRRFESWSMSFQNISKLTLEITPGVSRFLNGVTPEFMKGDLQEVFVFLTSFRDSMR